MVVRYCANIGNIDSIDYTVYTILFCVLLTMLMSIIGGYIYLYDI